MDKERESDHNGIREKEDKVRDFIQENYTT